jgi:hypothetical protein
LVGVYTGSEVKSMGESLTYLERLMLCDADCVDFYKPCNIRQQNHPEYCYYKKRKVPSVPNNRKKVEK